MKIAKGFRCSVDELLVGVDPAYDRIREAGGTAGADPLRRCRVQDGDEVYVQLASGGRLIRLVRTTRAGYMLQAYNHAYRTLLMQRKDIRAMDVIVSSRLREF